MDAIDKAKKLIALSASSSSEEARTAAYQACKLIRENKLALGPPLPEPARGMKIPKRDPDKPLVHLSSSGYTSLCSKSLAHEINFYTLDKIPTLQNVCEDCLRDAIHLKRR